jgi:hypothetical protein
LKAGVPRTGSIGCFTDGPISESQLATAKELDLNLLPESFDQAYVVWAKLLQ